MHKATEPWFAALGKAMLVSAPPAPSDRDEGATAQRQIDPRADVAEGLPPAGGTGGSTQSLHASKYRAVTEDDLALIETALDDLQRLVILYERRLIFKDRYRREAMLASASLRNAHAILRGANSQPGAE